MARQSRLTTEMQECTQDCLNCYSVCIETMQHCLAMGGRHAAAEHIRLMQACAAICQTSAEFMLMGSEFHGRTCGVCAEVCAACEQDCAGMAQGDETMQRCADMCRRCAESCRRMAAST
jgi:hypothetical protein